VNLPLLATLLFLLPTVVLAALAALLLRFAFRRPVRRFLAAMGWLHLGLFPLHLFVTFPLWLGWFSTHGRFTRYDERAYAGPRIGTDGRWQIQSRETLRDEATGTAHVDPEVAAAAAKRALTIRGADGNLLRAYRVAAKVDPPRAVAVLVHGLFRSAMEVEPPAAMLRRLGCECWLCDQRGHGGSIAAPLRLDDSEARDLVAVVKFVRSQPGRERTPLVLFGVSIGTVAVSLALPSLPDVAGVVLDAPVDDLLSTADRILQVARPERRGFLPIYQPWRTLVLESVELWSGCSLADVQPLRVLADLPRDLPMLVVAGGEDDKIPVANAQRLFDALPMPTGVKELWIDPAAGHGNVWLHDPAQYEKRLGELLARLRSVGAK
jgi:alpha-beta hydrolase superfamily lysophospholipase